MKKSICFIITQGEFGGAQRYVFDLATTLNKNLYRCVVIMGPEKLELKNRLEKASVTVMIARNLVRNIHPVADLLAVFELKHILQKLHPDLVHLNSSKAGVLGSLAAKLAGIEQVIFTAHGFAFLEPHNWFIRRIYFAAEKLATKFRSRIICVSEFDRRAAIKAGLCAAEKLVTIHNGIELNPPPHEEGLGEVIATESSMTPSLPARPAGGSPPHKGEKDVWIGTVANDYRTKDLPTLKQAFALIKKRVPEAELIIVGRGGTTGEVPDATSWLSKFDIYACSSIKEGFPYTILEAMAQGLPIVATAVGGIPEILTPHLTSPTRGEENINKIPLPSWEGQGEGVCGILVPPQNPHALAEAVVYLLKNPKIATSLGAAARERVKDFSLEKMVKATEAVYDAVSASA